MVDIPTPFVIGAVAATVPGHVNFTDYVLFDIGISIQVKISLLQSLSLQLLIEFYVPRNITIFKIAHKIHVSFLTQVMLLALAEHSGNRAFNDFILHQYS